MAVSEHPADRGASHGCGSVGTTSTGPIFVEGGCEGNGEASFEYLLARSDVTAVSVDGGSPIATMTNPTLPDGLRAAAIELTGYSGSEGRLVCSSATPLGSNGQPIAKRGRPGAPLAFFLPEKHWEAPARPPHGACELSATRLPPETAPYQGSVATTIKPFRDLVGQALMSCAGTVYLNREEHHLPAAVLLSASHPGAAPPPLPGMKPFAGHPGFFEAPSIDGQMVARRIRGAWLVVGEANEIGLAVPLEILEQLRARVR
jgi:hypothetical protein